MSLHLSKCHTVGNHMSRSISDRYGRKIAISISTGLLFAVTFGTSFTNSYVVFTILRILTGAVAQVLITSLPF